MNKTYCDKCGKEIPGYNSVSYTYRLTDEEINNNPFYPISEKTARKDICPDCTLKFRELLDDFFSQEKQSTAKNNLLAFISNHVAETIKQLPDDIKLSGFTRSEVPTREWYNEFGIKEVEHTGSLITTCHLEGHGFTFDLEMVKR